MSKLGIHSNQVVQIDGKFGPAYGDNGYSGIVGAVVKAATPGGLHFIGTNEASDDNQIHLQNCDVEWQGADFTNFYRAIRPQDGRCVITDCSFHNCCQPIMAGACEGAVCHRVVGRNGNDDLQSPDDDHAGDATANHMGYWSFAKKGPNIKELEAYDFNGCGVHLNGKDGTDGTGKSAQFNTQIDGMKLVRCGSGGTHAFQPDNNQDCTVNRYLCVDPKVGPLAFWHNDMGPHYACKRWKLTYGTLWCRDAKTNIHIGEGTEDISFDQYIFVLANDRMFADAESGEDPPYTPEVTNSIVFYQNINHVPGSVKFEATNKLRPISDADAFFKDLDGNDSLVPVDPAVTQGWRPAGLLPPVLPPVIPPVTPPVIPPVTPPVIPPVTPVTTPPVVTTTTAPFPLPRPDIAAAKAALAEAQDASEQLREETGRVVNPKRRKHLGYGLDALDDNLALISKALG